VGQTRSSETKCKMNGEPSLLLQLLYKMSPLYHKRARGSLAPPIFYAAKMAIKT